MISLKQELQKLSDAEKILLVEDIWDSIADEKKVHLSKEKKAEIKKRLALDKKGEMKYYSMEKVKEKFNLLRKNV